MLADIIASINDGTFKGDELILSRMKLVDDDVKNLMDALQNKPEIAAKIISLNLSDNPIKTLQLPNTLVGLQSLRLRFGTLEFISIPNGLINLQVIDLTNNQLENIDFAQDLKSLEWMNLQGNISLLSLEPNSCLYKALSDLLVHSNKLLVIYSDAPRKLPQLSLEQMNEKLLSDPVPGPDMLDKREHYNLKMVTYMSRVESAKAKELFMGRLNARGPDITTDKTDTPSIKDQPSIKRQTSKNTMA